ncbi:FtsW/RodA/SpoVE family cell cycle protein [bacterium]|nr:FtsW/RodA/SpoVE family cell cycle protein [bacterium]MBU1073461.1 FtsW/RodA/SpoVE family cell cycle protein [bacterium]MBU1674739.1 FtsW/RodA/SpoVE family cell cycle protein [bacterium]
MNRRARDFLTWLEQFDGWLLLSVVLLAVLGLVMVYNAGSFRVASSTYYLVHHLARLIIGFALMVFFAGRDYRFLRRPRVVLLLVVAALVMVSMTILFRGTALVITRAGASRWLNLPYLPVQPVELLKVALVIFLAHRCAGGFARVARDRGRLLVTLAVPVAGIVLLVLQPNFGNAAVMLIITILVLFVAGLPARLLAGLSAVAAIVAVPGYFLSAKIASRLDAWWTVLNGGRGEYQVEQSLIGLGAGGWHGAGFGASHQRFSFLPDPHTDFIFSVMGEELGLIGCLLMLFLFVLFAWRGYNIARTAGDDFGSLTAAGLTTMIVVYAVINIGMVTALLPVMGLPLPFVSYGGSAMITNLAAVGILLSIDRQGRELRALRKRVTRIAS